MELSARLHQLAPMWREFEGVLRRRQSRKWIVAAIAAATLITTYLLAGFFLVPGLIRSEATSWVKTKLNKPLALGEIRFNPILWRVDVSDVAIPGQGHPMVALGHLRVSFSILSIFESAYYFGEIRLDRPYVDAVIRADGTLNLSELVPKSTSKEPNPTVRIGTFSVNDGTIVFADDSLAQRPRKTLSPITFSLNDFETNSAEGGAFNLRGDSDSGESFAWTGTLSISPISSRGHAVIHNLRSASIQKFAGDVSPVALTSGLIDFSTNYGFAYEKGGLKLDMSSSNLVLAGLGLKAEKGAVQGAARIDRLSASLGGLTFATAGSTIRKLSAAMSRLSVGGVAISPLAGTQDQTIKLTDITLARARFDYGARRLDLGSFTITGADLPVRREHNGAIRIVGLTPAKFASTGNAPTARGQPWSVRLGTFVLDGAAIRIEDDTTTPKASFAIAPLNLTATGLATDLSTPANVRFDARINDEANIRGEGTLTPADRSADFTLALADLPLRAFLAYVPRYPDLDIRSGTFGASGSLHFQGGGNPSALRFNGDASIDKFTLRQRSMNSPLLAWRSFALQGIDYGPGGVKISHGHLIGAFGRIAVLRNRTFNYLALTNGNATASANNTSPQVQNQESPSGNAAAQAKALPPPARPALKFLMKRLDIDQGTMSFADYSITPNFQAQIGGLQGAILNISDRPRDITSIDLKGHVVDRFSPVTIKGSMDLFGYDRQTNLHMVFRNIELPIFNPYSGRYAGYAISKGKLTTELTYRIANRALTADHHIVIDQLEWGQATETKESVPFPVRLATALLKDKDGVIDLDVPVTGSLDDPKFRLGPIIWQIIGNILEKAVTAPFRLIGALFAGAEQAQYVDFVAGSANLPPESTKALGALAKALVERPALKLDIPAGPAIEADADAMADAQIDALLLGKEAKTDPSAAVAALDPGEQHDRLEDLYRKKLGKRPAYPDFSPDALKAAGKDKPELSDDDRRTAAEAQWLRSQLRPAFAPSDAELTALGSQRAASVRAALLADGSVDPTRVFIVNDMKAAPTDGRSRLELKFE